MGEKLNLELNLLLKTPRTISDDLLKEFSKNYNMLKEKGYIPVEIRDIMCKEIGFSHTTYYTYLRLSRNAKYITDSYSENLEKFLERQRRWRTESIKAVNSASIESNEVNGGDVKTVDNPLVDSEHFEKGVNGTTHDIFKIPFPKSSKDETVDNPKIPKDLLSRLLSPLRNIFKRN
jgi:hypothetical protein